MRTKSNDSEKIHEKRSTEKEFTTYKDKSEEAVKEAMKKVMSGKANFSETFKQLFEKAKNDAEKIKQERRNDDSKQTQETLKNFKSFQRCRVTLIFLSYINIANC